MNPRKFGLLRASRTPDHQSPHYASLLVDGCYREEFTAVEFQVVEGHTNRVEVVRRALARPMLLFTPAEWSAFLDGVKGSVFEL